MSTENNKEDVIFQFQNKGAELICERLWPKEGTSSNKHFLLADEVGLGKTVTVAKVIEKRALELKKKGKKMRVGYICSNLALGKENAEKLNKHIKNGIVVKISTRDRLSLAFLDIYNTKLVGDTIILPNGQKVKAKGNIKYLYSYYLAPWSGGKLLFQKIDTKDHYIDRDWSDYYESIPSETGIINKTNAFNTKSLNINAVYENIINNLDENIVSKIYKESIEGWEKKKDIYIEEAINNTENLKTKGQDRKTLEMIAEDFSKVNNEGYVVSDRLKNEISDYINNRYKKDKQIIKNEKDLINNYAVYYYKWLFELIIQPDVEIYAITPKTSLKDNYDKKIKTSSQEERGYAFLLSPTTGLIDNNNKLYKQQLYDTWSDYVNDPWFKAYKKDTMTENKPKSDEETVENFKKVFSDVLKKQNFYQVFEEIIKKNMAKINYDEKNGYVYDEFTPVINYVTKRIDDEILHTKEHKGFNPWLNNYKSCIRDFLKELNALDKNTFERLSELELIENGDKISVIVDNKELGELGKKWTYLVNSTNVTRMYPKLDRSAINEKLKDIVRNVNKIKNNDPDDCNNSAYQIYNYNINCSAVTNNFIRKIIALKKNDTSKESLKVSFELVKKCCDDWMLFIIQCMSIASIEIDLILADEIQNFSKIIHKVNQAEEQKDIINDIYNCYDLDDLVVDVLGKDVPVIMMSATPFRIRSQYDDVEEEKDNADNSKNQKTEKIQSLNDKSDVYNEFLMITKYLMPNSNESEQWQKNWETYESEKNDAVSKKNHEKYKEIVSKQEEMLKALNIFRTERYMSGKECQFQEENKRELKFDNIMLNELIALPVATKVDDNDPDDEDVKGVRMSYPKSTPALFSFIEDNKGFSDYQELSGYKDKSGNSTLNKEWLQKKEKIFYGGEEQNNEGKLYNARFVSLIHQIFEVEKQHKLLFIPPIHSAKKLKGVFNQKRGISKRLIFSDYVMTTRSLSVLLTYEAERRVLQDLINNKKKNIYDILKNNLIYNSALYNTLFKMDINSDHAGSPWCYAEGHRNIFMDDDEKIESFCKEYFKYMTSDHSLMVLVAYTYNDNEPLDKETPDKLILKLYELILEYGAQGCIHDVFDEYIFASDYDPESFLNEKDNDKFFCSDFFDIFRVSYEISYKSTDDKSYKGNRHFALGYNLSDDKKPNALKKKISRFNSPFFPFVFISTSIGQEGFDFHLYCRKIVHWSKPHTILDFEQREGRINRYHSYYNRLQVYAELENKGMNDKINNWNDRYEYLEKRKEYKDDYSLCPHFVFPIVNKEFALTREFYYYPASYELSQIDNMLKGLGYYRSLLGSFGNDSFEEQFSEFIDDVPENERSKYFINLSPVSEE